jgi:hypothetical protein
VKVAALIRLALTDPRESPRRTWPLLVGLVFGIATWIVLAGFTRGAADWLRQRVGGSIPNRIRVSSAKTSLGPLMLGGGLNKTHVEKCRAIPGVEAVYRQAHFPGPCQLWASHQGQTLTTDVIIEGVDPEQVSAQVHKDWKFADTRDNGAVPCVIPKPVLDVINAGISAHTNLPNLSEDALIGRTYKLRVGASSFAAGPSVDVTADIVGVSDQLGVNGPAFPMAWIERHAQRPIEYHTLTLQLKPDADLGQVLKAVDQLGLSAPDLDLAKRIGQASQLGQILAAAFAVSILGVAGVGIASGFTVKIQLEQADIGLYRSLGATRRDILYLYLIRAAFLGLLGSLGGLFLGGLAGLALAKLLVSQLPKSLASDLVLFQPSWLSLSIAFAFAPLVAVAAAWLPAHHASRLEPGSILRGA